MLSGAASRCLPALKAALSFFCVSALPAAAGAFVPYGDEAWAMRILTWGGCFWECALGMTLGARSLKIKNLVSGVRAAVRAWTLSGSFLIFPTG